MTVSEEDFRRDVDYSLGSLHTQIVHTMWAEDVWYSRIHQQPRPDYTTADYPSRALIRGKWDDIEGMWRAYVDGLTVEQLNQSFETVRANGERYQHTVQHALMQIVNHGTDHRAQMLRIIHDVGGETFSQDIAYYFREQAATLD
jgi:uncharacterized damage-inducible protein DinB